MAERTIDEIDRKARDLILKGRDAAERANYDYAISLLMNALSIEPDYLPARKLLRGAQTKKFQKSGGLFKKAAVAARYGAQMMLAQAQVEKKPTEVMKFAEEVLNEDPTNMTALELLCDAALAAKMFDTAVYAMESVAEANPKKVSVLHKLAAVYTAAHRFDRARDTFDRILEIAPGDVKAKQGIRDAEAARSMKEGKWETAATFRDALKNKDEAAALEQASRVIKGTEMIDNLITENEARLATDPENIGILRTLGNLYADKNDYDKAVEYYTRVLELSASADPSLEAKITETISRKFDSYINAYTEALQNDPNSQELAQQVADLKKQKSDYLLQRAEELVARYPNEPLHHFDLGNLYYNAQRYDDAVREFQLAVKSPKLRIVTLNCLGLCYMAKGVLEIARDQFLKADAEHRAMDNLKKEIIYNLGLTYEATRDHANAYAQFKRIYEVDIGYKDVAARVESGPKK
jgi:tetratricopeptide (TPR) repeat protein